MECQRLPITLHALVSEQLGDINYNNNNTNNNNYNNNVRKCNYCEQMMDDKCCYEFNK